VNQAQAPRPAEMDAGDARRAAGAIPTVVRSPAAVVPPDPRFPVYDPHPHPLDRLACWLVPALGDPHWSTPPCCVSEPAGPEASL